MTAGDQGKAYDDAVKALKNSPQDRDLIAAKDKAKKKLNDSLEKAHQRPIS